MKDLIKFCTWMLLLFPLCLILNASGNFVWNILGAIYLFLLVGVCFGYADKFKKWLNAIEKEEDNLNGR